MAKWAIIWDSKCGTVYADHIAHCTRHIFPSEFNAVVGDRDTIDHWCSKCLIHFNGDGIINFTTISVPGSYNISGSDIRCGHWVWAVRAAQAIGGRPTVTQLVKRLKGD